MYKTVRDSNGSASFKIIPLKKKNPYKKSEKTAKDLEKIMLDAAKENGVDLQVNRFGSMINPFFTYSWDRFKGVIVNFYIVI